MSDRPTRDVGVAVDNLPEGIPALIAEARDVGENLAGPEFYEYRLIARLGAALEAVSAERDEALVVIGAIRLLLPKPMSEPLSRDFTGRPFPRTIDGDQVARILSRTPEHPKED